LLIAAQALPLQGGGLRNCRYNYRLQKRSDGRSHLFLDFEQPIEQRFLVDVDTSMPGTVWSSNRRASILVEADTLGDGAVGVAQDVPGLAW
jgi:hypothetical protein